MEMYTTTHYTQADNSVNYAIERFINKWYLEEVKENEELDIEFINSEYKRWMETWKKLLKEDEKQRELFLGEENKEDNLSIKQENHTTK